jgi:hypothetical protein
MLDMFLGIITCTKLTNRLALAQITEAEADSTIALLSTWRAIKQDNPEACDHQEKLPIVQAVIQKAIMTGTC